MSVVFVLIFLFVVDFSLGHLDSTQWQALMDIFNSTSESKGNHSTVVCFQVFFFFFFFFADCSPSQCIRFGPLDECKIANHTAQVHSPGPSLQCTNSDVTGIHFDSWFSLAGSLPSTIGLLSNLRYLSLDQVAIGGQFPSEIWSLRQLTYIQVSCQRFMTGCSIGTEIGLLNRLTLVQFFGQGLFGTLPSQIGRLTAVTNLFVSTPNIRGVIPSQFGLMSSLSVFGLDSMQITGTIPTEIAKLSNLRTFAFSEMPMTGTIPSELWLMKWLVGFSLRNVSISGTIPSTIGNLSRLSFLSLTQCRLSGTLPSELWTLTHLKQLSVINTYIGGSISDAIGNLNLLITVEFEHNRLLGGTVPSSLQKLSSLLALYLFNNAFSGTLPTELAQLPLLQSFFAQSNRLVGAVPPFKALCNVVGQKNNNLYFSESNCMSSCSSAPQCCTNLTIPTCVALNDGCVSPMPIVDNRVLVSNKNSTTAPCNDCITSTIFQDVWFEWIASCTGKASFELARNNSFKVSETTFAVYQHSWCTGSTATGPQWQQSTFNRLIDLDVSAGERRVIQIGFTLDMNNSYVETELNVTCVETTTTATTTTISETTTSTTSSLSSSSSSMMNEISTKRSSASSFSTTHLLSSSTLAPMSPWSIVGAIVGCGAVVGVAVLTIIACYHRRRRYHTTFASASQRVEQLLSRIEDATIAEGRATCLAYTDALSQVYAYLLSISPAAAALQIDALAVRERNRTALRLFGAVQAMVRRKLSDQIEFAIGDREHANDIFVVHEGKLKVSYVGVILREGLARAGLSMFIDDQSIHSYHGSKENAIDVGLLTSRIALIVLSDRFVLKKWPLYELFFALARSENENQFRIVVDLYNETKERHAWIESVERLALPWLHGADLPPSIIYDQYDDGEHRDAVIAELKLNCEL
jgi:hypothetical protein